MFSICSDVLAPAHTPEQPDSAGAADAWERALLDRQLEGLARLADMGLAIAAAIERCVTAEAPEPASPAVLHHLSMDFARVSRAVRLSFALQSRLIADFKAPPRARPAADGHDDEEDWDGAIEVVWNPPSEDPREVRKTEIKAAVRELAEAEALDREDVERLLLKAGERLDTDDYLNLFGRPFADIIAQICADLGLPYPPREATVDESGVAEAASSPVFDSG
jgi:hypothetical protein